ncbi:ATP-binding protein [Streptomyces vinaceus]
MPITARCSTAGSGPHPTRFQSPAALSEVCFQRTGLREKDLRRPKQMRAIAHAHLMRWGLSELAEDVEAVLSEVVANAFVHGSGDAVNVRFFRTKVDVRFEVTGGGRADVLPVDPFAEHGRGLLLTDLLTDKWGVSEDGTTTWCSFRLSA